MRACPAAGAGAGGRAPVEELGGGVDPGAVRELLHVADLGHKGLDAVSVQDLPVQHFGVQERPPVQLRVHAQTRVGCGLGRQALLGGGGQGE
jgi:hypothetical protein